MFLNLQSTSCAECGVEFGLPAEFIQQLKQSGHTFHCPNGHKLVFNQGTPARDSLTQALRQAEARLAKAHDHIRALGTQVVKLERDLRLAHRRRASYQGQVKMMKRRLARGQCPICAAACAGVDLFDHLHTHHSDSVEDYTQDAA